MVQLQPEIEAQLATEAQARGISVDSYVAEIVKAYWSDDQGLQEGLDDIAAGRTRPAEEVFAELHEKHGIRG